MENALVRLLLFSIASGIEMFRLMFGLKSEVREAIWSFLVFSVALLDGLCIDAFHRYIQWVPAACWCFVLAQSLWIISIMFSARHAPALVCGIVASFGGYALWSLTQEALETVKEVQNSLWMSAWRMVYGR